MPNSIEHDIQQLLKTKMLKHRLLAFKLSDAVYIMLINVKMSTFVGILTLMSMLNLMLNLVEHEKSLITLGNKLRTKNNNNKKLLSELFLPD